MGNEKRFYNRTPISAKPLITKYIRAKFVNLVVPILTRGTVAKKDQFAYLQVRKRLPSHKVETCILTMQHFLARRKAPFIYFLRDEKQSIAKTGRQFFTRRSEA